MHEQGYAGKPSADCNLRMLRQHLRTGVRPYLARLDFALGVFCSTISSSQSGLVTLAGRSLISPRIEMAIPRKILETWAASFMPISRRHQVCGMFRIAWRKPTRR